MMVLYTRYLWLYSILIELSIPANTPRGFHVETTWKRPFSSRFNVESTWCVCRVVRLERIQVQNISRTEVLLSITRT